MIIRSGGQTGADFGALRAAREHGLQTGGWAAKGWLIEGEGGRGWVGAPWLADYGLAECPVDGFPVRTEWNVRDSEVTVWFGATGSAGFKKTREACDKHDKPMWWVDSPDGENRTVITTPKDFLIFLKRDGFRHLNCCGNRESKNPGIEDRVFRFLSSVFRAMAASEREAVSAQQP